VPDTIVPAGWYDDGRGVTRYWNGSSWTDLASEAGPSSPNALKPLSRTASWTLTAFLWVVTLPILLVPLSLVVLALFNPSELIQGPSLAVRAGLACIGLAPVAVAASVCGYQKSRGRSVRILLPLALIVAGSVWWVALMGAWIVGIAGDESLRVD
jgi:hypothetical protein